MQSALHTLDRRERRRLVSRAVVRTALTVVMLFALYALAPVPLVPGGDAYIRLAMVIGIVVAVITLQIRSILGAGYPELQAVQSFVTAITLFMVLFALFYLGLATADPASFTRPLTRVSALYFTVTVMATVGFGDITAQSEVAQMVVTVQMLLGLILFAFIVRAFAAAARAGATRREADRDAQRR